MKRNRLLVFFILLALCTESLAAMSISENIEFFKNKMDEIKGKVPVQISATENPPPECGTPVSLAIYNAVRNNPRYEVLASTLERPDLPSSYGTTHFLIHYTTTGDSAAFEPQIDSLPGIPRYVTRVADVFEHVWNVETDSLSYNQPPSDQGTGGDSRYDVYLVDLGTGTFGYTTPESIPNYGQRAASYIILENDFVGFRPRYNPDQGGDPILAVKVTAAHEFFHAIQFSYDQSEFDFTNANDPNSYKPWWMEASAVWMEDVVYTDINDYISYLQFFYNYIWMGLGTFSYVRGDPRAYHPYGSMVWPRFMTDKYNNLDLVRQIWTIDAQVRGYNTLPATNTVLGQYDATLQSAFLEFEVWNFHIGNPDSGGFADTINYYHEGNLFNYANGKPIMAETTAFISDLPSRTSISIANLPNPPEDLAANMIVIRTVNEHGGVALNFNGQSMSTSEWHVGILGFKPGNSSWIDIGVDPHSGAGAGVWPNWNFYSDVVVIPTVSGLNPDYSAYTYGGEVAYDPNLGSGAPNFAIDKAYPSPFIVQGDSELTIIYSLDRVYNSKRDLNLLVYDMAGNKVMEFPHSDLLNSPGPVSPFSAPKWDGKNNHNEYVASGIYILLLKAGDKSTTSKIAVINNH
jgi:hypothetical protein